MTGVVKLHEARIKQIASRNQQKPEVSEDPKIQAFRHKYLEWSGHRYRVKQELTDQLM
jgi:hypothetical protein